MTCVKSLLNKENKYKPETSRPASKNHFDKPIKYITFPQISNTAPIIIGNLGFLVISDHLKKPKKLNYTTFICSITYSSNLCNRMPTVAKCYLNYIKLKIEKQKPTKNWG